MRIEFGIGRAAPLLFLLLCGAAARAAAQAPPLTLRAVVEAAGARHPLTEAAKARVTAAEGVRRGAGALPNPVLTYQVENRRFPGDALPAGIDAEVSSYATLPLEPLFQRWPRLRAADAGVRAADAEVVAARHAAALDAARAFYRVARARGRRGRDGGRAGGARRAGALQQRPRGRGRRAGGRAGARAPGARSRGHRARAGAGGAGARTGAARALPRRGGAGG